jgi:hypothetical protein
VRVPVVLAPIAVLAAACGSGDEPDRPSTTAPPAESRRPPGTVALDVAPRLPPGAVAYADRRHAVRVRHPTGWHRARANLTPRLAAPGTILALGNRPLRPGGGCSRAPDHPRVDIGPRDAAVFVEEEANARADLAPARPRRLVLRRQVRRGGERLFPWDCLNRVGIAGLRTMFRADDRVLHVTVVVGESAGARTQSHALGIAESLEFGR